MEALAAVGLVGNILQLLDFSLKIVSKSQKLYRSGKAAVPENVDSEAISQHLLSLHNKVAARAQGTNNSELCNLCSLCSEVTTELLEAFERIKVKGKTTRWKSVRAALKAVWTKDDIQILEQRLNKLRKVITEHTVHELR
jgi:hypothetical protein